MLNRIRLVNFRKYTDKTFEFTEGLNILVGENGTGKSSLLEALGIVLFNAPRTSLKDTIQKGKDYATLYANFAHNGQDFTVVRSYGSLTEYVLETDGQRWEGKDTVVACLTKMFGSNLPELFRDVLAVRQFAKLSPFDSTPNDRLLLFGRILGIQRFEQEFDYLRDVIKLGERERDEIVKELSHIEARNLEIREHNLEVRETCKEIPALLTRLDELKGLIAKEYERANKAKEAIQNNRRLRNEIASVQVRINELNAQLKYPATDRDEYEDKLGLYNASHKTWEYNRSLYLAEQARLSIQKQALLRTEAICPVCGELLSPRQREELIKENAHKLSLLKEPEFNLVPPPKPYRWDDGLLEAEMATLVTRMSLLQEQLIEIGTDEYGAFQEMAAEKSQIESKLARLQSMTLLEEKTSELEDLTVVKEALDYLIAYRKTIKEKISSVPVEARKVISEYADTLYKQFMEGHHDVGLTLDTTYGIMATIRGREVPFSSLSGAESLVAALAVRLAIVYYLARDLRMFFLDEPTDGLDETALPQMANIVENLDGQVFVVTHRPVFNSGNIVEVE